MKCAHDLRAVCWLCSYSDQPWWPEARARALETGILQPRDMEPWVRTLQEQRRLATLLMKDREERTTG